MGSSYDNEEITTKIPALDPKLDIVQTETVKEETDDKKTRTRIKTRLAWKDDQEELLIHLKQQLTKYLIPYLLV